MLCNSCKICQLTGKPNKSNTPCTLKANFYKSFSETLIHILGPLPKTKKGNKFLLIIICTNSRFPDAIPSRTITVRTIVPALI